jgi:hypothetical protein
MYRNLYAVKNSAPFLELLLSLHILLNFRDKSEPKSDTHLEFIINWRLFLLLIEKTPCLYTIIKKILYENIFFANSKQLTLLDLSACIKKGAQKNWVYDLCPDWLL